MLTCSCVGSWACFFARSSAHLFARSLVRGIARLCVLAWTYPFVSLCICSFCAPWFGRSVLRVYALLSFDFWVVCLSSSAVAGLFFGGCSLVGWVPLYCVSFVV